MPQSTTRSDPTICSESFPATTPRVARQAGVAMIYQELSLAPDLSVAENITLGVEPARLGIVDRARTRQLALEALTELGRADLDPASPVRNLSRRGPPIS